jgi:hypothetical protein
LDVLIAWAIIKSEVPLRKVPKGYMALELFFVSARTIKRHHHHWVGRKSLLKHIPEYHIRFTILSQ